VTSCTRAAHHTVPRLTRNGDDRGVLFAEYADDGVPSRGGDHLIAVGQRDDRGLGSARGELDMGAKFSDSV